MKPKFSVAISALVCAMIAAPSSGAQSVSTIEDYNKQLPFWGVSWAPGAGATNGYYPTFYTGFAMRQQAPEKIHVRLSRGNQTRVSVILDETTIQDYLFDLVKRNDVYKKMAAKGVININPANGKMLPQLTMFGQILESPTYGIAQFVAEAKSGGKSAEAIYAKGLEVLSQLNPGRVFPIQIDLRAAFLKWKSGLTSASASSETNVMIALNNLVPGRVNFTEKPTALVLSKLSDAVKVAGEADENKFVASALTLFKEVTGSKYQIKVLSGGKFVDAIQCSVQSCTLTYPEFTAIYPTGTAMASMSDGLGNKINRFATPGLWPFIDRSGGRGVDNIRDEPYYGFAPKMDYQDSGNGFHNPAVRFYGVPAGVKTSLGIPSNHNTLWAVKRGDVSHGCARLPLGHLWEMRQIFPVENARMVQIHFFGNDSRDFDVFDVNGDGKPEVMGVEYTISYNLQGASGLARREGADLEINTDSKLKFFNKIYGSNGIFTTGNNNQVLFKNPGVSLQTYMDLKKAGVKIRYNINGDIPLYEQDYERDKVQFYSSGGVNKKLHRLMGRVRGCAPTSDKAKCGEAAFDSEAQTYIRN